MRAQLSLSSVWWFTEQHGLEIQFDTQCEYYSKSPLKLNPMFYFEIILFFPEFDERRIYEQLLCQYEQRLLSAISSL